MNEPIFQPGGKFRLLRTAIIFAALLVTFWIISAGVDYIWPFIAGG